MTGPTRPRPFRRSELSRRAPLAFRLAPDAEARAALARELGISAIRKLAFEGALEPEGRDDWRLVARLGATVVQPCVVTLEPVVTRIDETVTRRFVEAFAEPEAGSESEMPEDDTIEPLGAEIDPAAVMAEALALALPDYPRAPGAEAALPPEEPSEPARESPFAALAALRGEPPE